MKVRSKSDLVMYCPVCNSQNTGFISTINGNHKYAAHETFALKKCFACTHVFIDLIPDRNFYKKYYPYKYAPHNDTDYYTNSYKDTILLKVKSWLYGARPTKDHWTLVRKYAASFLNVFAYRALPNLSANKVSILDIGCSTGIYLSTLKNIGWSVYGVEPGEKAANLARDAGIKIIGGDFARLDYQGKPFDIVTMWHVLEHFSEPRHVMEKVHDMLSDNGILIIGVPNYNSLDRIIFSTHWNGFEVPLHLQHFNSASIEELLSTSGFNVTKVIHTIRPSDIAKSLGNTLGVSNPTIHHLLSVICVPITILSSLFRCSSIIHIYSEKLSD